MSMKKLLLGTFALAALMAGPAMAADLARPAPVYVPPPPVPVVVAVFSWTGFYIGANIGADWQRASFTSNEIGGAHIGTDPAEAAAGTGSNTATGFTGGGQIGFNWQYDSLVVGAEADINGISGKPSIGPGPFPFTVVAGPTFTLANTANATWLATVRGRIGFAADRVLVYLTGGAAFTTVKFSQSYSDNCCSSTPLTTFSTSSEKTGYALGGGLEYAFTNNWIGRVEYLYAGGFADVGGSYLATAGSGNSDLHSGSGKLNISMARVGLNYKFGYTPAPTVYK
jgi:outer membrane immunogenic protein